MDKWLLCFILGAILSLLAPDIPALFYKALILITLLCAFAFAQARNLACFLIGILWMFNHASSYQSIWQDNQLASNTSFYYQQHQASFHEQAYLADEYLPRTQ